MLLWPGGSLFLFDRRAVRFFRKDAHNWRKKADGKTVRETHEKLKVGHCWVLLTHTFFLYFLPSCPFHTKRATDERMCLQVGNVEMLNCYYAHADTEEGQQVNISASQLPLQINIATLREWL